VSAFEAVPDDRKGELHEVLCAAIMRHVDTKKFTNDLVRQFCLIDFEVSPIANYQYALARTVLENEGRLRSGLTEAIWMHGGPPCEDSRQHAALNGRHYNITTGLLVDGKPLWPGIEHGCRCWSKPDIPGFDD
jgi:hypothetical protein